MSLFILTLSEDPAAHRMRRSPFWCSQFVFRPRGITRQWSRCRRRSCDSCCKPWSQPDPFRSYKSFRNFSACFCTTRTPKLLAWLKNVLIRHTFVLKFVQNESATKGLHINQSKVNFNSGFDIIFDNIDGKLERRYMSKDKQTLTSIEQTIKIVKIRIL